MLSTKSTSTTFRLPMLAENPGAAVLPMGVGGLRPPSPGEARPYTRAMLLDDLACARPASGEARPGPFPFRPRPRRRFLFRPCLFLRCPSCQNSDFVSRKEPFRLVFRQNPDFVSSPRAPGGPRLASRRPARSKGGLGGSREPGKGAPGAAGSSGNAPAGPDPPPTASLPSARKGRGGRPALRALTKSGFWRRNRGSGLKTLTKPEFWQKQGSVESRGQGRESPGLTSASKQGPIAKSQ